MIERYKRQWKKEVWAKRWPDANLASINRELALLSHMFNRAITDGKAQFNPVKVIQRFQEVEKTQILEQGLEEERLFEAIRSCHKTSHMEPITKVLAGTACRVGEVLIMRREQIGPKLRLARNPKTSIKDKKPKIVRFSDEVWSIIETSAKTSKEDQVFSKNDGTLYKRINKAWNTVRETMGGPDLRIHDLKRTVLTRLGNREYDAFIPVNISPRSSAMDRARDS